MQGHETPKGGPPIRPSGIPMTHWPRVRTTNHYLLESTQDSSDAIIPQNQVMITHDVSVSKEPARCDEERGIPFRKLPRTDRYAKDFGFDTLG